MEVSFLDIAEILRKAEKIVIATHVHPDGDAVGSALAMYFHLVSIGKKTQIMIDDNIPHYLKFLPGSELIAKPNDALLGADLIVALDVSDAERCGQVKSAKAKILNIDHHASNTKYADYWYVDDSAAATGEIVLTYLRAEGALITEDIAVCLYTAIATDCGFFRFSNTTATTFRYAAELVECGVKPNVVSEFLVTKSLNSIQTLPNVLESLEICETTAGITVASLTINRQILDKLQHDTEDFIDYPRNIEGIEIAVVYKLVENNEVRVSIRSKTVNVSLIALSLGGGGHPRAAGCTITGSLNFAKKQLMAAIDRYAIGNANAEDALLGR